jgi:son of sevenless
VLDIELLNKNFEKESKAKTIFTIQRRFNLLSGWIATQIVTQTSSKTRAKYISHFITVGQRLLDIQNYHGLMAIVVAMNQSAVSRLRESWKKVSGLEKWKALEQMMSPIGNFRALRALHDNVAPPLIPTPTLYMKDLLFIEDGNEDWYDKEKNLISWEKIKLLGKILARVQLAQEVPYKFHKVHVIHNFLTDLKTLTEDELDQLSRQRESRSAEI